MALAGVLDNFAVPAAGAVPLGGKLAYFTSGALDSPRAVVFIGGLFNGLGDVPYLSKLSGALQATGWELVQLHWSSAYAGFGTGSLDRDVAELAALVAHLRKQADSPGTRTIVIMGHSTGSQDVIHYLTTSDERVDGGIMQAPVSDREYFAHDKRAGADWMAQLPLATQMVGEGRGWELLDRAWCDKNGLRMTAYRLWSLLSPVGDDDYFSSDIPAESSAHPHALSKSFGCLRAPALALFSENDEFRPRVDSLPAPEEVMRRWEHAGKGKLTWQVVRGASHAVEQAPAQDELCSAVVGWLARFD